MNLGEGMIGVHSVINEHAAEGERSAERTRIHTKMALRRSGIHTCSIFVNPDIAVDFDDSVITLNNPDSASDETIDVSWKTFASNLHPDEKEAYAEAFRKLCRGEVDVFEVEVRMKFAGSDEYKWYESVAHLYERDEQGRPTVILLCLVNIQKRKTQELLLKDARLKAEAADKMKSKYLADMSHEIRTPLNAITGFAELMAFADSDEERISYYEIIKTNNQLLTQLVNDILDLSKIEADAITIAYLPIDVNELIGTIYASARLSMPEGVVLMLESGADSCIFGTDGIRLLQLITNLVNNAIKNTHSGSITLGYSCLEDGHLRFYVRDTGVGIAKEKIENLFDRFVKLNDYVEGIGLGLAICKSLIAKMGGSIYVESEEGKGSEFSFVLPPHEVEVVEY